MDLFSLTSSGCTEIRCNQCKNLLSYFPIFLCENDKNLCGRCTQENSFPRNNAYEAIAQFLKFPCRYSGEGCQEELRPKEMAQHESNCFHRILKCPMVPSTECSWEGQYPYMLEHCMDEHFEFLLEEEFEIDVSRGEAHEHYFTQNGVIFVVTIKFYHEDNVIDCSVSHSAIDHFSCEIQIRSGNRKLCIEVNTSKPDAKDFNRILLDSVKDSLSKAPIYVKFNCELIRSEAIEKENEDTNLNMLQEVRCTVCREYAVPPIYQCWQSSSNVLCCDCNYNHVLTCQNCKLNDSEITNVTLNKMASLLKYPCKYGQDGCKFFSKSDQIKLHQRLCSYATIDCPLGNSERCNWLGLAKDVGIHLDLNHPARVIPVGQLSFNIPPDEPVVRGNSFVRRSRFFVNRRNQNYKLKMIKFANRIFRLIFAKTKEDLCWKLEIICGEAKDFRYVIDIVDQHNNGRGLSVKQVCAPFCKNEDFFEDPTQYCSFNISQIKGLILNNEIIFNIHIVK